MAGIPLKIPGTANIAEGNAAQMAAAIQWSFNTVTAPPIKPVRWPSAGDLGKRLQTARLA
jgi:hypothetical protein